MACKGTCQRYKHERHGTDDIYDNGASRCSFCCIFLNWDGQFCPCCGMALRKTSRSKYGSIRTKIDKKRY